VSAAGLASSNTEDGVDLVNAWQFMWRHRLIIAMTALVTVVAAVILALTMTPIFRGEVVVTEVHDDAMGGMAGLAGQLGGLASLAGVNLPLGSAAGEEAKAILKSRKLADEFVKRNGLVPVLLKPAGENQPPPEPWFAVQRFREDVVAVRDDKRTGTITVAVEWPDAELAARWANAYVALANETIRQRALDESKRNIAYLQGQAAQTNVVELQRVLYRLIEAETQTSMVASGRIEYAFSVVDPAVPPKKRVRPHRTVMVLLGMMLGVLLGVIVAFVYERVRHSRTNVAISTQKA
jgi:uncharacterized protein involved in exopolysaccharide biosynthesis